MDIALPFAVAERVGVSVAEPAFGAAWILDPVVQTEFASLGLLIGLIDSVGVNIEA
jgi:hypothetical protein